MVKSIPVLSKGSLGPFGASEVPGGINFSFFSSESDQAEIHVFVPGEADPFFVASLSPDLYKTDSIWHVCIENLEAPFEYSYKIVKNFNWSPLLLDPYAKALSSPIEWGIQKDFPHKARFFSEPSFDWQEVEKPKTPFKEWIIYEMHVRGFSNHPSSLVKKPGTFLGVIEKIPHLKSLGVNAIELLPVFEFNECENPLKNPNTKGDLVNFWGYSHVSFFCPMQRYASSEKWEAPILEFKEMVRELHRNGIAVILDVVYNHTAEKGEDGPTFSFKGLGKSVYYLLDPKGEYYNFSGTGNAFNCNHPVASKLIIDSLVYWTKEMQVDAFRFDLASIMTRGEDGEPLSSPPVLEAMASEPSLQNTHFIAEAWDAAGLYQVGSFPGVKNWSEWNGKFRDVTRSFIKGTDGFVGDFAGALCGSQNLYSKESPERTINFIISHDGYTLCDLVSYQDKHNKDNGEENKDGDNNNHSWNCGVEGITSNQKILFLRKRQIKNFIVAAMLSLGVPMIFMGDEYSHTRKGNNNPYCQDNELNWFLWDSLEKNSELFLFFQKIIKFRKEHKSFFCRESFFTDEDIVWHGEKAFKPDWSSRKSFLAYTLKNSTTKERFFISFNAQDTSVLLQLPSLENQVWSQVLNTSLRHPYDFVENKGDRAHFQCSYLLTSYSVVMFKSERL